MKSKRLDPKQEKYIHEEGSEKWVQEECIACCILVLHLASIKGILKRA